MVEGCWSGGVAAVPARLSYAGQLWLDERIPCPHVCMTCCMRCAQALRHVMGPTQDIPGPEISAGSRVMSYWFDEYTKYKGFSPACATGALLPCRPPCALC